VEAFRNIWSRYPAANASLGKMCGLARGIGREGLTHIQILAPVSVSSGWKLKFYDFPTYIHTARWDSTFISYSGGGSKTVKISRLILYNMNIISCIWEKENMVIRTVNILSSYTSCTHCQLSWNQN
jgi:hypothetical protein